MKVQEHIDKISWTGADKFLFMLYGIVTLFQINALEPDQYGLFALLINLNIWIFLVSDAFFLQGLIQFGMNRENRSKVNAYSLIFHTAFVLGVALLFFAIKLPFSKFFNQPEITYLATILPFLCLITIPRTFSIKLLYREHLLKQVFFVDLAFFGTMSLITGFLISTKKALVFEDMLILYFSGTAASSLFSIYIVRNILKFSLKGNITVKKFLSFGFPLMLQSGFHSLPKLLDVYLVQKSFSTASVGIYAAAKTLFRVFDESVSASYGLVYPAAVRLFERKDFLALNSLITKFVSFMLFAFLAAVLLLEAGLTDFIIGFLPAKYSAAASQYNLMLLAALAIPFAMLSLLITAYGKPTKVLFYTSIASFLSMMTFYYVGKTGDANLIPLGIIVYYFILGILCFRYVRKEFGFPYKMIFRAYGDTKYYIKAYLDKKRKNSN